MQRSADVANSSGTIAYEGSAWIDGMEVKCRLVEIVFDPGNSDVIVRFEVVADPLEFQEDGFVKVEG